MKYIEVACQTEIRIPYKELIPLQGELKSLSKENYERLKRQIIKHGFCEPISVWFDSGKPYILNGHQRLRTVQQMIEVEGYQPVSIPVVSVEAEDIDQAKRILLGLASQYGKVEAQGLYEFISHSDIQPHELEENYHYPEINTDEFVDEYYKEIVEDKADIEDDVPEVSEAEVTVKLGDIYQLGEHRLMCGDSTDKEIVDRLMNGEKADMVFTDPPYGMNLDTDYSKMAGKGNKYRKVINDDKPFDPSFLMNLSNKIVLFGADYFWSKLTGGIICVWDKRTHKDDHENNLGRVFGSHFEIIWSNIKKTKKIFRHLWCAGLRAGKSEERTIDGSKPKFFHPTQKPIDLCIEVIDHFDDQKSKSVLDLFGGSGSTLIACEKTNRKCFMMEIDPHYCQVIIDRWEKYTGKKAIKIGDGTGEG